MVPIRPETQQQQGFPAFFVSAAVHPVALQTVRRWGHILGHLPPVTKHMPPLTDMAIRKTKPTSPTQKLFDGRGLYMDISSPQGRERLALDVMPL